MTTRERAETCASGAGVCSSGPRCVSVGGSRARSTVVAEDLAVADPAD